MPAQATTTDCPYGDAGEVGGEESKGSSSSSPSSSPRRRTDTILAASWYSIAARGVESGPIPANASYASLSTLVAMMVRACDGAPSPAREESRAFRAPDEAHQVHESVGDDLRHGHARQADVHMPRFHPIISEGILAG